MRATVAERGQVTIPKALRERLGITPGTQLEFRAENGALIATKRIGEHPVFSLIGKLSKGRRTADVMRTLRDEQP
jgi:antitoxin PrlF